MALRRSRILSATGAESMDNNNNNNNNNNNKSMITKILWTILRSVITMRRTDESPFCWVCRPKKGLTVMGISPKDAVRGAVEMIHARSI